MAYPRVESYPTIYCAHASTRQAILKLPQPQDYGNTPGFQSNFSLLLMILEFNMWGRNMPTTSAKSSKKIIKSQNIGKEKILQAFTWNVNMPPRKMTAPSTSQYKDILK